MEKVKLEDYRQGYPRLAAFLLLAREFTVLRRFDYLHMRSLLDQQDRLADLEEKLHHCDDAETTQLHLSSRRQDSNQRRRDLLDEIKLNLSSYDQAIAGFHTIKALQSTPDRHVQSVLNWVFGHKPLVRSESKCYLGSSGRGDFVTIAPDDPERAIPEALLDMGVRTFPSISKYVCSTQERTTDDHIFLFPPSHLRTAIRCLIALILPVWMIFHVIILNNMSHNSSKAIVYSLFIISTSFVVMITTNATKYNLLIALLTYAAIPTSVFLGSNSQGASSK
ncbi:uncharacterized protein F4807DRAFT_158633 [Annulohypoxylon truncatum]|uniref:uncharacterized protein n=1 Tax=Annulohypoxylon truncatum TaxID=327061 RepID=UPI00200738AB|nr:uncharacterized protein F4807DRAFT_158633 [Annulohypoxylon truncatum]KAI1208288.1 hypothetical protein F4807DRAFT_158633 [Annulohypoxylon truncatum]